MSSRPKTVGAAFVLDLFVLTPLGALSLMLGLPLVGVNGVGYWEAVGAHILLGFALSSVRFVVRTERDMEELADASRRKARPWERGS